LPDVPPWAPTLTDGVVTLRAHREADVPDIVAHCSDPLMARWTRVPRPYTVAHAREFVAGRRAEWESGRELGFAIEHEGRYAGSVDLRPAEGRTAEVGYALAPWARGRGAMTATLRLLLPWAFEHVGLTAVHWRARVGNWGSRRVAWATGFRVEGQVRRSIGAGTHAYDAWVGSLLRGEPMQPAHVWLTPPALIGDRVLLRGHRPDDAQRIVEACADASTQRWLPLIPAPYGPADAVAHLEQLMSEQAVGEALTWAVSDPRSDLLLGEIGVFGLGGGTGRYGEIGYWAHPRARGQGLTTEALRLVARHCLLPLEEGGLGLPRVVVRAARGNVASQRVARHAGFRPAGVDRAGEVLRDGSVQDLLRFDLLPDELPVPAPRPPRQHLRGPDAPHTPPGVRLPGGGWSTPAAGRLVGPDGRPDRASATLADALDGGRVEAGSDPSESRPTAGRLSGRPFPVVGPGGRDARDAVDASPAEETGSAPAGGGQSSPVRGRWSRAGRHRH
jgi:RimJ/RimL family protein N-acetyltransferase